MRYLKFLFQKSNQTNNQNWTSLITMTKNKITTKPLVHGKSNLRRQMSIKSYFLESPWASMPLTRQWINFEKLPIVNPSKMVVSVK